MLIAGEAQLGATERPACACPIMQEDKKKERKSSKKRLKQTLENLGEVYIYVFAASKWRQVFTLHSFHGKKRTNMSVFLGRRKQSFIS